MTNQLVDYNVVLFMKIIHGIFTDSDGSTKKTLNGTWILADEFVSIKPGMNLRAGTTTFEARVVGLEDYKKNEKMS